MIMFDEDGKWRIDKRGDHDEVFRFVANAMCHMAKKGAIDLNFAYPGNEKFQGFPKTAFSLIEDGASAYFDFALEFEFRDLARVENLTRHEFAELCLLNRLMAYARNQSVDEFMDLVSHMGSFELRNELSARMRKEGLIRD